MPTHERGQLLQWATVVLSIMLREAMILAPLAVLARFIPSRRRRAGAAARLRADSAEAA